MIIEISISVIAAAFVLLVIFLIINLRTANLTIKKSKHLLTKLEHELSEASIEGVNLMKHLNALTLDVHKKVQSLDFIFRPLERFNEKSAKTVSNDPFEKISQILGFIADGMVLIKKMKGE